MLSYPCSEVIPTTLSTAELKERIAQEVERCQLCTAEQEEAKRARDDAQERQRLRRELENERASTASAQRFTRFFERQAADIDEDRVRVCILNTCSCCGYHAPSPHVSTYRALSLTQLARGSSSHSPGWPVGLPC